MPSHFPGPMNHYIPAHYHPYSPLHSTPFGWRPPSIHIKHYYNTQLPASTFKGTYRPLDQIHALDTDQYMWIDDGKGERIEAGRQRSSIGLSKYRNGLSKRGDWKLIGKERIYGQYHKKKRKPIYSSYFELPIYDENDYRPIRMQKREKYRSKLKFKHMPTYHENFEDWDSVLYNDKTGWTVLKKPRKKSTGLDRKRIQVSYTRLERHDKCARRSSWQSTEGCYRKRPAPKRKRHVWHPGRKYEVIEERYVEDELEDTYDKYLLLDKGDRVVIVHPKKSYYYS
ncbi:unnamed protein product [Dicrocoelium dendriticum]|nr:unnamed protein product [Dicrocoelium dendriticum]